MNTIRKHNYPFFASLLSILTASWLFWGCTETNQVIFSNQKPVIEAFLAPGKPVSLKLTTVIGYSDDANSPDSIARPIDGQNIKIKVSDGKVFTLKSLGEGLYESAANEIVKFGLTYTLDELVS